MSWAHVPGHGGFPRISWHSRPRAREPVQALRALEVVPPGDAGKLVLAVLVAAAERGEKVFPNPLVADSATGASED